MIPAWPERRLREAIELAFMLGDGRSLWVGGVPSRLFRFVPPEITVDIQLKQQPRMIDVDIKINFLTEATK